MEGPQMPEDEHASHEEALPLPPAIAAFLEERGAQQRNIYRALAAAPALTEAWRDYIWALRDRCTVPRDIRELVILREAALTGSPYERHHHLRMARQAGLDEQRIADVEAWEESSVYSAAERAALSLADALHEGRVTTAVLDLVHQHFDQQATVELALTAGTYMMLGPVLDALRVQIETEGS